MSLQLRFLVGHHCYRRETTEAHNNIRVTLTPRYLLYLLVSEFAQGNKDTEKKMERNTSQAVLIPYGFLFRNADKCQVAGMLSTLVPL